MTVSAIDKSVFLGYTTNITTKHGENMEQLTESNALFTYLERCKCAAKQFTEQANSMESRQFKDCQEFWAKLIADGWQVEVVDMLAETNTQWR
tara:strand:+ start:171 stop:449 length:279 start_codon:yes stop_codon:yes gene_type:complete